MNKIDELQMFANKDCSCTPEQRTGDDLTRCLVCDVRVFLNDIYEQIDREHERIFNASKDNNL